MNSNTHGNKESLKKLVTRIVEVIVFIASLATIASLYLQKTTNDQEMSRNNTAIANQATEDIIKRATEMAGQQTEVAFLIEQRDSINTVAAQGGQQVDLLSTQNAAINERLSTLVPQLPTVQIATNTPIPISSSTTIPIADTPTPIIKFESIDGVWDFQLYARQKVGKDGFILNSNDTFQWVVRLDETGATLQGEIIGAKTSTNLTACTGNITGTIQGNVVNFTVYYGKSCCPNERGVFNGILNPDGISLEGKVEPENIPTSDQCTMYYSDVTAVKR